MKKTEDFNQKEIEELLGKVIKEAKSIKIPVSKNILREIRINRRAKSRFAACKKELLGKYRIEVSNEILRCTEQDVRNILAHEVLHTCPGCLNHGKKWKKYSEAMNRAYGYNISRTTTYEQLRLPKPEKRESFKYLIQCERCGMQTVRQRKSKLIKNISSYRCKCGGKLRCTDLTEGVEKT